MKYLIGPSQLAQSAALQYKGMGEDVAEFTLDSLPGNLDGCDELFIAPMIKNEDPFSSDSILMSAVKSLLGTYRPESNGGRRLLCHLLLQSRIACDMLLSNDLAGSLNDKIEFWPFTLADICAQGIDFARKPIPAESDETVHLVIFGMTSNAEAVIKAAALTCHYPNYCRNHSLRTRITVIDENIEAKSMQMRSRYSQFLSNGYVRTVDVRKRVSWISRPEYSNREDFVDIEWEFVSGSIDDADMKRKVINWASNGSGQLCIVVAYDSDEMNVVTSGKLYECLESRGSAIYLYLRNSGFIRNIKLDGNIHLIAEDQVQYDVSLPLRRMAQMVNYVYSECYDSETDEFDVPIEIDTEKMLSYWQECRQPALRWSSVCNAMSIKNKMLSLGHLESDWQSFYSMTAKESELLSEVEHNRWTAEKLMSGFRPLSDVERSKVAEDVSLKKTLKTRKAHYDLVAFSELQKDETGKNARMYDVCLTRAIPLIASLSKKKEEDR